MNLLLIDDEETLLELFEEILVKRGYNVYKAIDGESALDIINDLNKVGVAIDLAIVDYRMYGLDGITTAKKIKLTMPNTKILISSADDEIVREMSASYIDGFIKKPFRITKLLEEIKKILS